MKKGEKDRDKDGKEIEKKSMGQGEREGKKAIKSGERGKKGYKNERERI